MVIAQFYAKQEADRSFISTVFIMWLLLKRNAVPSCGYFLTVIAQFSSALSIDYSRSVQLCFLFLFFPLIFHNGF